MTLSKNFLNNKIFLLIFLITNIQIHLQFYTVFNTSIVEWIMLLSEQLNLTEKTLGAGEPNNPSVLPPGSNGWGWHVHKKVEPVR